MSILDAMSTSVTGLVAQSYALNNISGNIANSSTPGFKTTSTSFSDLLTSDLGNAGGGGAAAASRQFTGTQGTVASTGVATNLAISGNGLFVVAANTGSATSPSFAGPTLYTRRGDFAVDGNGYLVNGAGDYLLGATGTGSTSAPTSAPLNVSSMLSSGSDITSVTVSASGTLTGTSTDGTTARLGQVTLAHFASTDRLQGVDGGAYMATAGSGSPSYGLDGATLTAGSVEQSNANVADQFAQLITTQQAYAAGTKVLTATDDMMKDVISMYV